MDSKKIFCDITKCVGCRTCELACAVEHSVAKDLFLAILERPRPKKRRDTQFIERNVSHSIGCQHCDEPPCVEACMASCISKDKKTGKVDIDIERCVGCWMCIMVCPFASITRRYAEDAERSYSLGDASAPRSDTSQNNHIRGNKALKCDLCPDRDSPACVDSCPTRALSYETRSEVTKKQKVVKVSIK